MAPHLLILFFLGIKLSLTAVRMTDAGLTNPPIKLPYFVIGCYGVGLFQTPGTRGV